MSHCKHGWRSASSPRGWRGRRCGLDHADRGTRPCDLGCKVLMRGSTPHDRLFVRSCLCLGTGVGQRSVPWPATQPMRGFSIPWPRRREDLCRHHDEPRRHRRAGLHQGIRRSRDQDRADSRRLLVPLDIGCHGINPIAIRLISSKFRRGTYADAMPGTAPTASTAKA